MMCNKLKLCKDEEGIKDCFALIEGGYCVALQDTNFHGKLCPFYKPKESLIRKEVKDEIKNKSK